MGSSPTKRKNMGNLQIATTGKIKGKKTKKKKLTKVNKFNEERTDLLLNRELKKSGFDLI